MMMMVRQSVEQVASVGSERSVGASTSASASGHRPTASKSQFGQILKE